MPDPVKRAVTTFNERRRYFLLQRPRRDGESGEVWMRYPNENTQELYDPNSGRITSVNIPNLSSHGDLSIRTALALGVDREKWMASRHESVGRF